MADPHRMARRAGELKATLQCLAITLDVYAIPLMEEGVGKAIVEKERDRIQLLLERIKDEDEAEARDLDAAMRNAAEWRKGLPQQRARELGVSAVSCALSLAEEVAR